MKIFISYSSKDRNIAEQINLALVGAGHDVFFDQTSLPPAGDYNGRIKKGIDDVDYLVYLISPDSVSNSSYALTELKFYKEKWKHPKNHVLPVIIRETDFSEIPNYLKAVTFLEPIGNIPAEVVNAIGNNDQHVSFLRSILLYYFIPALGVAASIIAILNFSGISTVGEINKSFLPVVLAIEPRFRGRNIEIEKLNIHLDNPTDRKSCEIKKATRKNTVKFDKAGEIKVVCKNLERGRNISYSIESDNGKCYANGDGLLGGLSNPFIDCEE